MNKQLRSEIDRVCRCYAQNGVHPDLDKIADKVLRYRPKPKTKAAKRRIRRKKRQLKKRESSI